MKTQELNQDELKNTNGGYTPQKPAPDNNPYQITATSTPSGFNPSDINGPYQPESSNPDYTR